jgi:hypothetical protein
MRKPSASTQVVQTPNQLSPPPAEAQMPPVQTRTDRTRLLLPLPRKLMQVPVSPSTWLRTLLPELRWTVVVVQKRWVDRKLRRSTSKVSYLVVGMPFVNDKLLVLHAATHRKPTHRTQTVVRRRSSLQPFPLQSTATRKPTSSQAQVDQTRWSSLP